jgi:uncharacterized membrane protein HdeD (DUF308 family)
MPVASVREMLRAGWWILLLRKEIRGEWLLALAGIVGILFGLGAMARPAAGALALAWLIGAFALVEGVALVAVAVRVRRIEKAIEKGS